jgi:hypothetical protein
MGLVSKAGGHRIPECNFVAPETPGKHLQKAELPVERACGSLH